MHDRFSQLCDPERSGNLSTRDHYPSFVSFIGNTTAGKSTLVRAILLIGMAQAAGIFTAESDIDHADVGELIRAINTTTDLPVTRSSAFDHAKNATSLGVHLYRDKGITTPNVNFEGPSASTNAGQYPMFFADCEGFGAGDAPTNAELLGTSDGDNYAFQFPITAPCYGEEGKVGIDRLYARFLYAISDVVVFVTKEDTTVCADLISILEWAAAAVYKSVNHPSRKTLILVRNKAELHKTEFYETKNLQKHFLCHSEDLWEISKPLKSFCDEYNRAEPKFERRIYTNKRLYEILFHKILVWNIPKKDDSQVQPSEVLRQWIGLRGIIESSVAEGQKLRSRTYNVPALSHIFKQAFEHFTTSEQPFDFYLAARRDNLNPQSMSHHIGNFLRHAYDYAEKGPEKVGKVDSMISGVISMSFLVHTVRNFHEGMIAFLFPRHRLIF